MVMVYLVTKCYHFTPQSLSMAEEKEFTKVYFI